MNDLEKQNAEIQKMINLVTESLEQENTNHRLVMSILEEMQKVMLALRDRIEYLEGQNIIIRSIINEQEVK
jgi:arginine deiminase